MIQQLMRTRRLLAGAVVSTVLLGACSGGASPTPLAATQPPAATIAPASPSAEASAAAASAPASAPAGASAAEVDVATTGTLAPYLTGANGKTLYVYAKDTSSTSTCTGGCASAWPPLTVAAGASATAGTGVTGTLATSARADGSMQVTYNGKPLYYFASDSKAGDTGGNGVAGVWSVAKP
jgi:predicted lipoprotein with Yx(FWY)xxD motif